MTLTGNARQITTGPATAVRFVVKSLALAVVVGPNLIISGERSYWTDNSGDFAVTLAAGDYKVTFNGTDEYQIHVGDGSGTVTFLSCVTSDITEPAPPSGETPTWPEFPNNSPWVLTENGRLWGRNRDTGDYHELRIVGPTDAPTIELSTPGGEIAG